MRSPVADLLEDLGAALDTLGVRWYLFGAQAAILYGVARLTADVDVTVQVPAGRPVPTWMSTLAEHHFEPRFTDQAFLAEGLVEEPHAQDELQRR